MRPFEPQDVHCLRAAVGWLELGNHREANSELDNISPEMRAHPDVLEIRYRIYAKELKWRECRDIAEAVTRTEPSRPSGWIGLAYATRRAPDGGIEQAQAILLEAIEQFPKTALIPYNLACYACVLGELKCAWQWLERAFDIGEAKVLKLKALDDPDLERLWTEIQEI